MKVCKSLIVITLILVCVYIVKVGDSLSKISKRVYGREDLWAYIYWNNQGEIEDCDMLIVGQRLKIRGEEEYNDEAKEVALFWHELKRKMRTKRK